MTRKQANTNVNWQQRAAEFAVGDAVVPFGYPTDLSGTVTAVWPAIGMVDVEFALGNKRYPVEDLQRVRQDAWVNEPVLTDTTPGGRGTVPVPGGPYPFEKIPDPASPGFRVPEAEQEMLRQQRTAGPEPSARRVAEAMVKKAIYWGARDRKYRATKSEQGGGPYLCPKDGASLQKAIYKREDGKSTKLLGCPVCMFLIREDDIIQNNGNGEDV